MSFSMQQALLEMLRSQGVKRAVFGSALTLVEVEFFSAEPTSSVEGSETERAGPLDEVVQPYEHALNQIRLRKFVQRGEPEPGGDS